MRLTFSYATTSPPLGISAMVGCEAPMSIVARRVQVMRSSEVAT